MNGHKIPTTPPAGEDQASNRAAGNGGKTSPRGIALVKEFEGFRSMSYPDIGGKLTIGYGHLILHNEKFDEPISEALGEELLRKDLAWAERAVNRLVKVALNQNQYDALVSLTFNIGNNGLARSTLLKVLNGGSYQRAADKFLEWNKVRKGEGLVIDKGLTNRRKKERDLFLETPS